MATEENKTINPMEDMESVLGEIDKISSMASSLASEAEKMKTSLGSVRRVFDSLGGMADSAKAVTQAFGEMSKGGLSQRGALLSAPIDVQKDILSKASELVGKRYFTSSGRSVPYGTLQRSRELGVDYRDLKVLESHTEKDPRYSEFKGRFGPTRLQNEENQTKLTGKDYVNAPMVGYKKDSGGARVGEKIATEIIEEIGSSVSKAVRGSSAEIDAKLRAKVQGSGAVAPPPQTGTVLPQQTKGSTTTPPVAPVVDKVNKMIDGLSSAPAKGEASGRGGIPNEPIGGSRRDGGFGGGRGDGGFDIKQFLNMASPFSPTALSWMAMFGMSGQLQPAAQQLGEPSMMGGEWMKQGVRGTMGFGASFTGIPALGKLFNQVATTDAFELYESMHSSFTVLKNVYKSQEKAGDTIQESINLARQTPLEVNDLLKIFSTFSVNPQLRGVLGNKEQMGQLATGVAGLSFLVPEQGTQGAIFAIREALAGQFRSLRNRFNINPELIAASGGMSMTEMQEKPTNFLGALDSFLKQNLGQNTFNELQNTFSKQVGNIYDSLTGGIFKAFRQSGTYESVTNFASQLSNVTGNLFESEGFGNFFKTVGGKITNQFSKASNVLKSMDFNLDTPEVLKEKFGKAFQMVTKDVVTATGEDMDSIISVVSPVAKNVGNMVSGYLSKGLGDVVSGAMGIGVNSIVETLSSGVMSLTDKIPGVGGGLRWIQEKVLPYQRDIITEHPFMTLAAGAMLQKPLVNWASGAMQTYGGFTPYMRNIWENDQGRIGGLASKMGIGGAGSGWKGITGIASVAASLYSLNQVIDSFAKDLPDVDENQRRRYGDYERGKINAFEYLDTAYSESIAGAPYKRERRGFIETGMMGIMGGMTISGAMRKSMENPYSFLSTWLSGDRKLFGDKISSFMGPPKPQPGQWGGQSEDRYVTSLVTGRRTKISPDYYTNDEWSSLSERQRASAIERRNPQQKYDSDVKKFVLARQVPAGSTFPFNQEMIGSTKITPFSQTYTGEQLAQQRMLGSQLRSKESPFIKQIDEESQVIQSASSGKQASKIKNSLEKGAEHVRLYFVSEVNANVDEISKIPQTPWGGLRGDFNTDMKKRRTTKTITDVFESDIDFEDESGTQRGKRIVKRTAIEEEQPEKPRKTPQQRLAKWGGIAAGLGVVGASLMADYMMEDEELTSRDANIMKRTGAISQQIMSMAPVAGMIHPLLGAGIFAGGAALDIGSKLTYGTLWGSPEKAAGQKADRNIRLEKVNKDVAKAISTIAEDRINQVTDFNELNELSTFVNMDMNAVFQQQLVKAVSSGKVSQDTGDKLRKELPKLGRSVIEGRIKENATDIKQWLVDNDIATKDELEKIEPTDLQALVNSAKGSYVQSTKPDAAEKVNRGKKAVIREEMAATPELAAYVNERSNYGGSDLQNTIMMKSDQMNQVVSALEKRIAFNRWVKLGGPGGASKIEDSISFAKGAVEEMQGTKDFNQGQNTIKQIAIPTAQYMEDKVYNWSERGKAIYRPGQLEEAGFRNTSKAVLATMNEAFDKELLFNTKPNAQAIQKMREESKILFKIVKVGDESGQPQNVSISKALQRENKMNVQSLANLEMDMERVRKQPYIRDYELQRYVSGPITNAPKFSQEWLAQEQELDQRKSNYVGVVPTVLNQLSQTHPGALSIGQLGTFAGFRMETANLSFEAAKKQFDEIPTKVEGFIQTLSNIPIDKVEPSTSLLNNIEKLNKESHDKIMKSALKGQKESVAAHDADISGLDTSGSDKRREFSKEELEKKEKEFEEIINRSGTDAFSMRRDLKLAGAGNIGEGKDEKDFYQQVSNYNLAKTAESMLSGLKPGEPAIGTIQELRSFLNRNMATEAGVNTYAAASNIYDQYMAHLGQLSSTFQYNAQEQASLRQRGPNYTSINGQLMPSSFSIGGVDIANPEVKMAMDQQRQANQYTPETKALINERQVKLANRTREIYKQFITQAENLTGGANLSPEQQQQRSEATLKSIGFMRQFAEFNNVTLGGELLGKEDLMRQTYNQNILEEMGTTLYKAFERGDTQAIVKFGEEHGFIGQTGLERKEGKSPTAEAATMSGVGAAMESIAGGLSKFGDAITYASERAEEFLKNISNVAPNVQPKTEKQKIEARDNSGSTI